MPDPDSTPAAPDVPAASPCRHLRSKGMYVYTDGLHDPHGESDSSICWCLKTMKSFGPDDDLVSGEDCRNPARTCYEEG